VICVLVSDAEGFQFPPQKVKAIKAVKRVYAARTKRYSDFQLNAQSFCTGLCMYEEQKSYEDCYDTCNGYWEY